MPTPTATAARSAHAGPDRGTVLAEDVVEQARQIVEALQAYDPAVLVRVDPDTDPFGAGVVEACPSGWPIAP